MFYYDSGIHEHLFNVSPTHCVLQTSKIYVSEFVVSVSMSMSLLHRFSSFKTTNVCTRMRLNRFTKPHVTDSPSDPLKIIGHVVPQNGRTFYQLLYQSLFKIANRTRQMATIYDKMVPQIRFPYKFVHFPVAQISILIYI